MSGKHWDRRPTVDYLLPSFQMALGFMQFGFVAIYLSESFIRGFMTAAGLQILISVLKYIFGLTIPSPRPEYVRCTPLQSHQVYKTAVP